MPSHGAAATDKVKAKPQRDHERMRVVVRVRPLLAADKAMLIEGDLEDCTRLERGSQGLALLKPYGTPKDFTFDRVLGPTATQEETFESTMAPVLADVMRGYNGTVLCYGQTGTGKSFTAFGASLLSSKELDVDLHDDSGLAPRAVYALFDHVEELRRQIEANADGTAASAGGVALPSSDEPATVADGTVVGVRVFVSFAQLYMEKVTDLLAPGTAVPGTAASGTDAAATTAAARKLSIREDRDGGRGVFVEGLLRVEVDCAGEVFAAIRNGVKQRATGATLNNKLSSRSHAILQLTLEQEYESPAVVGGTLAGGDSSEGAVGGEVTVTLKRSTLTVVDLAGSERVNKSGSAGVRLDEARKINKSIAALGNCVAALARTTRRRTARCCSASGPCLSAL